MTTSVHVLKQKELEIQELRAELAEALYRLDHSHYEAFNQERQRADRAEAAIGSVREELAREKAEHDMTRLVVPDGGLVCRVCGGGVGEPVA